MARGVVVGGLNSGGGSNIKSIQRGTNSFSSAGTVNVPISAVDLSKSILLVDYSAFQTNTSGYADFINGTTIAVSSRGNTAKVSWQVIEFKDVKSLQRGSLSIGAVASTAVPVSEVDVSKSIVFLCSNNPSISSGNTHPNIELTDGRTLTVHRDTFATNLVTVYWQLLEFK